MKPGTIRFTATSKGATSQLLYMPRSKIVIHIRPAGSDVTRELGAIDVQGAGQFDEVVDQLAAVSQALRFFTDWHRGGSE